MAIDLAYWTYKIAVKTTLDWSQSEMTVCHRYSDFIWLRDELVHDHPGVIVPPLPEKDVQGQVAKVVINTGLLHYRQRALAKFLTGVGSHVKLHKSPHLKNFCEKQGPDFETIKATRKRERAETELGLWDKVQQRSGGGWLKMVGLGKAPVEGTAGEPERLTQRKNIAVQAEQSYLAAREKVKLITERHSAAANALDHLRNSLAEFGEMEKTMNEDLAKDFEGMSKYADKLAGVHKEGADREAMIVGETLAYYAGMYASVRELCRRLQRHHNFMLGSESALKSLQEAAAKDPKKAPQVEKAEAKARDARQRFDSELKEFDEEWARMHRSKRHELKHLQRVMVEINSSMLRRIESTIPPEIEDPA